MECFYILFLQYILNKKLDRDVVLDFMQMLQDEIFVQEVMFDREIL